MPTKVCTNCKQFFSGKDDVCESCKFIKEKKVEQMTNLVGAVEMLAILKGTREERDP